MKFDLLVIIFIILFSPALAFAHPGHDPEDILLEQANEAFFQANFDKAISLLDILLEHNPNNIEALNNKAVSLIKLEKFNEAFTPLNQVMKIDPENKEATANLEFIKYRVQYLLNPGFMEIQVYNSQGYLVTHFVSDNLWILNNTIAMDVINEFPEKKIINRDGKDFLVLQRQGIIKEVEDSTPARTGFSFSYNNVVMLGYSSHYQFLVEKGDVVVYNTNLIVPLQ